MMILSDVRFVVRMAAGLHNPNFQKVMVSPLVLDNDHGYPARD